ncbi:hypothetical protein L6164_001703 [Bauhinia variegata]|uniref:Uncharacterized protein n=1 Tax=Bauhinia variegata TaxID=167791 RepID=A0ACB9QAG4_BAUVA|nr:hypothetical protein L6164_001703 [Bauhinia variegata]
MEMGTKESVLDHLFVEILGGSTSLSPRQSNRTVVYWPYMVGMMVNFFTRKTVQLEKNGRCFDVKNIIQTQNEYNFTKIVDEDLNQSLAFRTCDAFKRNFTLPHNTPLVSFHMESITLFRCNRNLNLGFPKRYFNHSCGDYDVYCAPPTPNDDNNRSSLIGCSVLHFPKHFPDGEDIFTLVSGNIYLQVRLSDNCSKCYRKRGGLCQLDSNKNFHCNKACVPKSCGDGQNINFPFYIEGVQEEFCGYPKFGLSCDKNGHPILNLSNTAYIVQEISYENESIRVSDAAFSMSNTTGCDTLHRAKNFTYPGTRFHLVPNQTEMLLFFGCDLQSLPQRLQKYEAMVEDGSISGNEGILGSIRRGFLLKWVASDCSDCRSSGGRATLCAVHPYFTTCEPKSCGDGQNISYPFYIKGEQPEFCGYPNFDLSCSKNGHPILNLPNTAYIVREISYQDESIRVSDADFSLSNTTSCVNRAKNFTYPGFRFSVVPNQTEMFLFFGCDLQSLPQRLKKYKVGCSAENHTSSVLGLSGNDGEFSLVSKNCNDGVVKAMVEDASVSENEGILGSIERGFLLKWPATNCSECLRSGGKCGFDRGKYRFQCFCPDRPHAWDCGDYSGDKKALRLGLGLVSAALGVGVLLFALYCYLTGFGKNNTKAHQDFEAFLKSHGPLPARSYEVKTEKNV